MPRVFEASCAPIHLLMNIDYMINIDRIRILDSMSINKGLEGVVAAETALSLVDGERGELIIAGFPVAELALNATFEETVSLLWDAPWVGGRRHIPESTIALLRDAAHDRVDTMDALRMGAGTIRGEAPADVLAALPTIVAAYWRLLNRR